MRSSGRSARPTTEESRLPDDQAEAVAVANAHLAAVSFIEQHLFEPMSVKTIARASGLSPSRFSRGFTKLQGESVMAYLRGRRLEGAMRRILTDPGVKLIDLAFDCCFDSQEAFTRAFARAYGQTPGRLQHSRATRPLVRRRKSTKGKPEIQESIVQFPAIRLAGLAKHFTPANFKDMSGLWEDLIALVSSSVQLPGRETYGVFRKRYPADGSFDFLAAFRIDGGSVPSSRLEVIDLQARTYLVFRHVLRPGDLYPQVTAAADVIWGERLPRSGRVLADGPDFELYPANFRITDGWIDHYLPVMD